MNEKQLGQRLRELFPRWSEDFYKANSGLCAPERKQNKGPSLDRNASRKKKSKDRPSVCIVVYRCRLLDKENSYAATKCITDRLCEVGLIPGDSEKEIDLEVLQQEVRDRHEQRTEVKIIYP